MHGPRIVNLSGALCTVVETPVFLRDAQALFNEEERAAVVTFIFHNGNVPIFPPNVLATNEKATSRLPNGT